MTHTQTDLAERMATRKRNANLRVGTHSDIIGQALSKITPLMTQAVSALTVGYATYEGVVNFFGAPLAIGIAVGIVAALAVEGVGFVAVDERDRAQAHNRRTANEAEHVDVGKANMYVAGAFIVTVAIVATFESVPAIMRWLDGDATNGELLFRCGLLVFPFLSRLGANLFAFRLVREQVDHSSADIEIRELKLSLDKDELRARHAAKVAKITGAVVAQPRRQVVAETVSPEGNSGNKAAGTDSERLPETSSETIEKTIVRYLKANPGAKLDDIAAHANVTKGTVSKKVDPLVEMGVLHEERKGNRRILSANGTHEEFLAS